MKSLKKNFFVFHRRHGVCVCVCVCVAESRSQDGVRRSPGALIGGTFKAATPSPAALSRGTHPQAGAWQVALSQNAGPRPHRRAPSLRRTGAPTPAMEHNRHGFQEHAMPQAHSRQGWATSGTQRAEEAAFSNPRMSRRPGVSTRLGKISTLKNQINKRTNTPEKKS